MSALRLGPALLWRGLVNRVHQLTRKNGFLQIGNATSLQRLSACGRVIKARHEDDWKGRPGGFEALPQGNSGKPTEMNVQKQAIDVFGGITLKKCLGRVEDPGFKTVRIQQEPDGVECA
jgi:hypothetical protein